MNEQSDQLTQLISRLDGDPITREQVKDLLLALDEDIVDPLISVLLSEEGYKAYAAADILGDLKDERAIQPLIKTLRTKNSLLGSGIVKALIKYDSVDSVPIFIDALPHANLMTQQSIILTLQSMDDERLVALFIAQLHATSHPMLRIALIKALIEFGDPTILDDIRRYSNDPNHHVQEWVEEAITRLSRK